jgi:hypothetical protein
VKTGWLSEDPDDSPPMPMTAMVLARQGHRAGVVETALARSAAADVRQALDEAASAPDPDERAANLLAAGYRPGALFELQQQLGDVQAELESEREKIEKGARRSERLARDHAAGRISALDALRMQDSDAGDSHRCEQLERRAERISRQIAEASQAISPPQARRSADPLEDATRRANATFREVTRQRMAEAQQSRPQGPPPFAARASAGAAGAEHTGPDCEICAQAPSGTKPGWLPQRQPMSGPGKPCAPSTACRTPGRRTGRRRTAAAAGRWRTSAGAVSGSTGERGGGSRDGGHAGEAGGARRGRRGPGGPAEPRAGDGGKQAGRAARRGRRAVVSNARRLKPRDPDAVEAAFAGELRKGCPHCGSRRVVGRFHDGWWDYGLRCEASCRTFTDPRLAHRIAAEAAERASAVTGIRLSYRAFNEGCGRVEGAVVASPGRRGSDR